MAPNILSSSYSNMHFLFLSPAASCLLLAPSSSSCHRPYVRSPVKKPSSGGSFFSISHPGELTEIFSKAFLFGDCHRRRHHGIPRLPDCRVLNFKSLIFTLGRGSMQAKNARLAITEIDQSGPDEFYCIWLIPIEFGF